MAAKKNARKCGVSHTRDNQEQRKKKKKNDESDIRKSHQVSDIHAGHGSSQFMSLEEGEKYNKLYRYD